MRRDVYSFVYGFLQNHNRGKPKYFNSDAVLRIAVRKFGDVDDVDDASIRAFHDYYESDEFLRKLKKHR